MGSPCVSGPSGRELSGGGAPKRLVGRRLVEVGVLASEVRHRLDLEATGELRTVHPEILDLLLQFCESRLLGIYPDVCLRLEVVDLIQLPLKLVDLSVDGRHFLNGGCHLFRLLFHCASSLGEMILAGSSLTSANILACSNINVKENFGFRNEVKKGIISNNESHIYRENSGF